MTYLYASTINGVGKRMLDAIKELGDYVKANENLSDVEIFVDEAKLNKNTKYILCILLKHQNGTITYKKVILEDYDSKKALLSLYRGGFSGGTDILPSALITDKVEKTFRKRILNWFKGRDDELFRRIEQELQEKKEVIERDLIERYNEISKDDRKNVLITLKFEERESRKYIGEIVIFNNILVKDNVRRYHFLD